MDVLDVLPDFCAKSLESRHILEAGFMVDDDGQKHLYCVVVNEKAALKTAKTFRNHPVTVRIAKLATR